MPRSFYSYARFGLLLICLNAGHLFAQDIVITTGWKFKTGDQPQWASPSFNDSSWSPINIGAPWEFQGYAGYDGFAWYRKHIVIPSSIKEKAFLKERIRFDLGKIDDGDEVYLNGNLIGRNGGKGGSIQDGNWWNLPRSYILNLNDPRIHWDQDNVIAIRVYDRESNGGMFEGGYGISVLDVTDFVKVNTTANDFHFQAGRQVSKKVVLESTSEKFDFTGKLTIRVLDPFSGAVLFKQSIGADFAHDRPFEYTFKTTLPEISIYEVIYAFEEGRSKKVVTAKKKSPISSPPPLRLHRASMEPKYME